MKVNCTQCGGQIDVGEGELFLTCPYCSSAIYVDKKKVVFHYVLASTLVLEDARKSLKRWMAGNETVKGLEEKSKVIQEEFFYFPIWYFKVRKNGEEKVITQLAASTPIVDLKKMQIPAGDLKFYDPGEYEGQTFREPEMLYEAALAWLKKGGTTPEEVIETALVHIPVFHIKYEFDDETYSSVVEGSSGKVYSSIFPAKSETPFYMVAALAFILFLVEGLVIGNIGLKLIVYLITSVPLVGLAVLISERV